MVAGALILVANLYDLGTVTDERHLEIRAEPWTQDRTAAARMAAARRPGRQLEPVRAVRLQFDCQPAVRAGDLAPFGCPSHVARFSAFGDRVG